MKKAFVAAALLAMAGRLWLEEGHKDAGMPYVRQPFTPFSREEAVAVALREWRLFGSEVHDEPATASGGFKKERQAGYWQRVGDYFWQGLGSGSPYLATGKHDAQGREFPPEQDASYAWSAAFISYVMREAGAQELFAYSPRHAVYINAAYEAAKGERKDLAIHTQDPAVYAPKQGDLICTPQEGVLAFGDLPVSKELLAHCDMVVDRQDDMLAVIGGNVRDAVSMKHVPVTGAGMLVDAKGTVVDERYGWFVVIQVLYDD